MRPSLSAEANTVADMPDDCEEGAMSQTHTVRSDPMPAHDHGQLVDHGPADARHKRRSSHFWRHYLQMAAVMVAGMVATGAIFLSIVGLKTWDEVTSQYPTQALVAMAAGMSIPMVAWMLYRGMGRRNSFEMAVAMLFPVIPFLCLVWFGVTKSAQCGGYCALTFVTMYGLMRYRRSEYSMQM
jgi:cytochrome bd-type quinol oxidase subunit 2